MRSVYESSCSTQTMGLHVGCGMAARWAASARACNGSGGCLAQASWRLDDSAYLYRERFRRSARVCVGPMPDAKKPQCSGATGGKGHQNLDADPSFQTGRRLFEPMVPMPRHGSVGLWPIHGLACLELDIWWSRSSCVTRKTTAPALNAAA